jgi:RHH-type rel operon transcriptional repressor/antitoxin RelB
VKPSGGITLNSKVWQIGEIQQALKEADANDFASDDEIDALMRKYAG